MNIAETVYYNNGMGKRRRMSIGVALEETNARKAFAEGLIPELVVMFQSQGIENVLIDVVGSVAAGRANEESDIDLLVRQEGVEDLRPVIKAGNYVRRQIRDRDLPYKIHWWFSHPYIYS